MSKASKMIQTMDQLQITQKPYKAHYLAEYDQKIRQQYLQLLFSVVSLEGFNDAQQRIWQLLSQSIGVDGTSSDEMNSELIQNVVQSCVTNKLQHVFILDLLVLLRLNTVSEEQARILAELISLFSLTEKDAETLIHLSDLILNLSDKGQNLSEFKYETIRHWHEFTYQILTKELLVAGLNGGRWIQLNDITEVNKPINIRDSSLYCTGEKLISVTNHPTKVRDSQFDVNLKAENCKLEILETNFSNQSIELFGDTNNAFFEDCNFSRIFEESYDDTIYLNCPKGILKINKCNFQLKNIATINFSGSKITVKSSTFEQCGNPKGKGCISIDKSIWLITKNQFDSCISKNYGAAITIQNLYEGSWLEECNFFNCIGEEVDNKDLKNMGVYFHYYYTSDTSYSVQNFISKCKFKSTNVIMNLTRYSNGMGAENGINNSNFINSMIACRHAPQKITFNGCEFESNSQPNVIALPTLQGKI